MNLTIRHDGFEMTEAIDLHVRDRLSAALDQHTSHVRSVAITVRDENGPKGGVDKSCQVQVDLDFRHEPVFVKKLHDDLYLAVTDAADAVKRTVGKLVGKAKEHR
jgi:ribosome hibernation promoting factor